MTKQDFTYDQFAQKAEEGDAVALFGAGYCLQFGLGVTRSARLAEQAYLKAVKKNRHPGALFALACMYEDGWGRTENKRRAWTLLRLSARQGLGEAEQLLGTKYWQLRGDFIRAALWLGRAAAKDSAVDKDVAAMLLAADKAAVSLPVKEKIFASLSRGLTAAIG